MAGNLFIDIYSEQCTCGGEHICGDSFVYRRIRNENRTIIVLSDGMGHGVKANVLSTLTASMVVNFAGAKEDIAKIARIVLNNLPVCSIRKISYSTFTIVDIDQETNEVTIAQHDNPQSFVFRNGTPLPLAWDSQVIDEKTEGRLQTILTTQFTATENDRIVIMSDGVTQSGSGSEQYPFGWGTKAVAEYIGAKISDAPSASPKDIASDVVKNAIDNDGYAPKDDISCAVIHMRQPRKVLLAACPPAEKDLYGEYAETMRNFDGKKILCGHMIAEIVAGITNEKITEDEISADPDVPPLWNINGIDLVSEGIITINKVFDLLNGDDNLYNGDGAAYNICRLLTESDEITLLLGTKRGTHNSPYMTDEFELRRKTIRRIGSLLESRYMKEVKVSYI